jgi:predicted methyltransferase
MSERKTDYFGSFLETMKQVRGQASAAADPLGRVLKALAANEQSIKDLLPFTDNSLSKIVAITHQLEELGLIEKTSSDTLRLTDKGREYARDV